MLRPGPPVFVDVDASFAAVQLIPPLAPGIAKQPLQKRPSYVHPLLLPMLQQQTGSIPAFASSPNLSTSRRRRTRPELSPKAIRSLQQERMLRSGLVSPEDILPRTSSHLEASAITSTPSDGWKVIDPARFRHHTQAVQRQGRRFQASDDSDAAAAALPPSSSAPCLGTAAVASSKPAVPSPQVRVPVKKKKMATGQNESERKFWPKTFVTRKEDELSPEQVRSKDLRVCLEGLRRMGQKMKKPASLPHESPTLAEGEGEDGAKGEASGGDAPSPQGTNGAEAPGSPGSGEGGALMELLEKQVAAAATIVSQNPEPVPQVIVPPEPEDGPMYMILKECNDSEALVQEFVDLLAVGSDQAGEFGGARHASTIISQRTLSVARRKAQLLRECEERTVDIEKAHEHREDLLQNLLKGDAEIPEALKAVRKFIARYAHSPGNPVDADKGDFGAFCKTFKLPGDHAHLNRLRDLCLEVGEWWATACVEQAIAGEGHATLTRIFNVALGSGCDKDHPKLVHAMQILTDRLADRVLRDAEDRKERDDEMAQAQELPPVGPATVMGDKIEAEINHAIKEGVPPKDERLASALAIAKHLREQDGVRKRLHAREKRLKEMAEKNKK